MRDEFALLGIGPACGAVFPTRRKAFRAVRPLGLRKSGAHVHFRPMDWRIAQNSVPAAIAGQRSAATSTDTRAVADFVFAVLAGLDEGCADPACVAHSYFDREHRSTDVMIVAMSETAAGVEEFEAEVQRCGGRVLTAGH